ncbi:MAG: hypothetical protein WB646_13280 [Steroidobacteraceae bacterium]
MAGRKGGRAASARARGLRTLQHQTLSPAVRHAIETEVWLRGLLLACDAATIEAGWATKDQVHDEALGWFLQQHAHHPVQDYPARRAGDADLTFWLDSRVLERARRMAERDGVKVARLIDAALTAYVRQQVPREFMEFRQRVQADAQKLYAQHRAGLVAAGRARK